jgi:hypothetical protein
VRSDEAEQRRFATEQRARESCEDAADEARLEQLEVEALAERECALPMRLSATAA